MADTQLAPAPPQATITIPAPTVTAGWAVPAGQAQPTPAEPRERRPKRRGIPASPLLAGAGNATALSLSAVYEAGGGVAVAAAGGAVALGALGAAVRRRRTVARRRATFRSARQTAGSRGGSWGGSGSGSRGSWQVPRTGSGSGSGAGSRGTSAGSRTSGTGSTAAGSRGSGRPGSGRAGTTGSHGTGTGAAAAERLGRTRDRKTGGKGRKQQPALAARTANALGRQTARAWKATKPHRATASAAAKRHAKTVRGAAWDAVKALRSGVWGAIRHWSIKKGTERAIAAWRKHRANRKNTPDAAQPDITTATPERTISSVARKPTNPNSPTSSPGGNAVPGHHFTAPAMEMARAAASYDPKGMLQVGADFIGLQEALKLVAESMKITVENADAKQPLHPQIVDLMRQIHGLQLKAAELAGELQPAFKSLHQVDIARLENPRKGAEGERMWDVTTNLY